MISPRVREVLEALLKKSDSKQVKWVDTLSSEADTITFDYTVYLPDSSINLWKLESGECRLAILNAEGNTIVYIDEDDGSARDLLQRLGQSARESVLNVDGTLTYLKEVLTSDRVIGEPKPKI